MTTNPNTWLEAFISLMMALTGFFAWRAKVESQSARSQSEHNTEAIREVHLTMNSRLDQLVASKEAVALNKGRDEGRAESKVEAK